MSAKAATAPMSRIDYVALNTKLWVEMTLDVLSMDDLETFAKNAETRAHEKSRAMTAELKDDIESLTTHAAYMRTLSAKIVLLRDGLIPALKIDKDNPILRRDAVAAMGWIRADFEAMDCLMR